MEPRSLAELNRHIAAAPLGLDRGEVYVTNAVMHFKFEQRGKRRLHSRPDAGEVRHYHRWLRKELNLVKRGIHCHASLRAAANAG